MNLSIIKFLGFEQIFKERLLRPAHRRRQGGGAKDFDPKGKVRR